jgi:hypothetical protein
VLGSLITIMFTRALLAFMHIHIWGLSKSSCVASYYLLVFNSDYFDSRSVSFHAYARRLYLNPKFSVTIILRNIYVNFLAFV